LGIYVVSPAFELDCLQAEQNRGGEKAVGTVSVHALSNGRVSHTGLLIGRTYRSGTSRQKSVRINDNICNESGTLILRLFSGAEL
jgi:hypothetical protein